METRYCCTCGQRITFASGGRIYCSEHCRRNYYRFVLGGDRIRAIIKKYQDLCREHGKEVPEDNLLKMYKYKSLLRMYKKESEFSNKEINHDL